MRFSILIPVYNVEKYLSQCINSVLSQTFSDYEIILVNDGSTDSSYSICEEYSKRDTRIRYFCKENEGLLLTRRYSLKLALGEYILFLDSDDYWDPNLLEELDRIITNKPSLDLILFRFRRVSDQGVVLYDDNGIFHDGEVFDKYTKNIFLKEFVSSSRLNTLWSKCTKRNIIDIEKDYSSFKDKKGEDLLQSISIIRNANSIYYCDKVLMSYRLSSSGRGRNFKAKYIYDFEIVREYVYSILLEMEAVESVLSSFAYSYIRGISHYLYLYAQVAPSYNKYESVLEDINSFNIYKSAIQLIGLKYNGDHRWWYKLFIRKHYHLMYVLGRSIFLMRKLVKVVK